MEGLGDLLFELSNDDRRRILYAIQEKPQRLTQIANDLGLTVQETSRQISRLEEIGLEFKNSKGYHHLTPYGELIIRQLRSFGFTSRHKEYFKNHSMEHLENKHVDRIGDLVECVPLDSAMDFLRYVDTLFKESNEYVMLLVDQFPINSLTTIIEAIDRGVQFRIIEPRERVFNPNLDDLSSEETNALRHTRFTPMVDQKMVDEVHVLLYLSESRCILAFPTTDGKYDYNGFTSTHYSSIEWCKDVFQYYWSKGEQREPIKSVVQPISGRVSRRERRHEWVLVEGQENSDVDAQAVQDAVDNYKIVVLRGKFNIGNSSVSISNSVTIRGEGRENEIPLTSIYKKGWSFPFLQFAGVFEIVKSNLDVTIENIHFTDFNCTSINQRVNPINSMKILNNRITVPTGYGRGITYGSFGDWLLGILIQNIGKGGLLIEGNYIDLATQGIWRGTISRGERGENPEYRPDLFNHEYFVGFGIAVNDCSGKVEIKNNVIKNVNGRGIALSQHYETAKVYVQNNLIESDVYGSYPFSSRESTAGILAQTGYADKYLPSYYICIENNTIKLNKKNSSGIIALGPVSEGSDKLEGGLIRDNLIYLNDGYEGIHLRKCDDFKIIGNQISGRAYYGIRLSGHRKFNALDMASTQNQIKENNLNELKIKQPDDYVLNHSDGKMFAGSLSERQSHTTHIWLDQYSKNNEIHILDNELVLDEGENNKIVKLFQ
ncbi:MAG: ArsR family transcriptional regulator [Promethearchaeota archaeon]|jgi:predicted transcriptional regulator